MATDESLEQTIVKKLLEKGKRWNLSAELFPLTEHDDSKDTILEMMELLKLCGLEINNLSVCKKSATRSEMIRNFGNSRYKEHSNDKEGLMYALELYIRSITHAPNKSKELALSYANVSLVLYKLSRFEECLQAIDCCLSLGYPNNLKIKVLIRKTLCLMVLKSPKAMASYMETLVWVKSEFPSQKQLEYFIILKHLLAGGLDIENRPTRNMRDVFINEFSDNTKNEEIPALSSAVSLKYNNTYGRHLVATRDIRPGEIIGTEIPYCSIFKSKYVNCWNCSQIVLFPIPCDHCVYVSYCSTKCKLHSWRTFHKIECKILPHLCNIISDENELLLIVLRITILAIEEFGEVKKLFDELKRIDESKDPRKRGFSDDQKFQSNKFCSVYTICGKLHQKNQQNKYLCTAIIVYHLATKSNIFGKMFRNKWNVIQQNEEIMTFAKVVLKIFEVVFSNALVTHETYRSLDEQVTFFSILPTFNLLNHSCSPNAIIFYNNQDTHLITLCPVKKGEQLFINYMRIYSLPTSIRQELFFDLHGFKCKCIACERNWPETILSAPTENYDCTTQFYNKLEFEMNSDGLFFVPGDDSIDNIKCMRYASEKINEFFNSPGYHSEEIKFLLKVAMMKGYMYHMWEKM